MFLHADDGLWYRGRITKVVCSQHVEVCYIDFGNCETVPVSKVKTIKEELLQVPAQAIRCSLASISPAGDSDIEWPDDALERFKELAMQKQLVGEVIQIGEILRKVKCVYVFKHLTIVCFRKVVGKR